MRKARVQTVIADTVAEVQAAIRDLPRGASGHVAEQRLAGILATMGSQVPQHARDYVRGYCARMLQTEFNHTESSL